MNNEQLHAAQLSREESSKAAGIERYRATVATANDKDRGATTTPAVKLQKQLIEPCAQAIQEWIDVTSRAKRSSYKATVVAAFGAHAAAFVTLQIIINGFGKKVNQLVHTLANDIEANVQLAVAMKDPEIGGLLTFLAKEKYKGSTKHFKAYGLDRERRRLLNMPLKSEESLGMLIDTDENGKETILDFALTTEEKVSIGQSLIEIVVSAAAAFTFSDAKENTEGGLFQIVAKYASGRSVQSVSYLYPTQHYLDYIAAGDAQLEVMTPRFLPMLCEPTPWTAPYSGGYLTSRLSAVKRISGESLCAAHAAGSLDAIYATLNKLQAVKWRYNAGVHAVVEALWNDGAQLACWPMKNRIELPAKPAGFEADPQAFMQDHPLVWKKWKKAASIVNHENESVTRLTACALVSQRIAIVSDHLALGNPKFHEVYQCDFRGRAYPVAGAITSQGSDIGKALMEFSEGMAIDENGADWIRIHLANSWANDKIDKKPLAERIQWVYDNEEAIYNAGKNPLDNLWWTQADGEQKPWVFLAACIDYAGWLDHGVGYISHLPVAIDGSCNGIQHYAAAMRSEADGSLVNLMPVAIPADIYTLTAVRANEILADMAKGINRTDAEDDDEENETKQAAETKRIAGLLAGKVTRGVAKRPTMTFSYSVSLMGIKEQLKSEAAGAALLDTLVTVDADGKRDTSTRRKAVSILASAILAAIKDTVTAASKGMLFLQGLTKFVGSEGKQMEWTLPDGFRVQQNYRKSEMRQIRTVVSGAIRLKKDKVALIQQDIAAMAGLDLGTATSVVHTTGTKAATKDLVKQAKVFIQESGVLKLYRTDIESLVADYNLEFDFAAFIDARYKKMNLQPVPALRHAVGACIEFVVRNAITAHHFREELQEETDTETGEITSKRVGVSISEPTAVLDLQAQVRGIGPNVIHSLDACHMRMTLAAAATEGIEDFAMVHDSYGCHAANMTTLARITREQFVACHTEPAFDRFANEMIARGDIPEVAVQELRENYLQYGQLDLNQVLDSEFFFS